MSTDSQTPRADAPADATPRSDARPDPTLRADAPADAPPRSDARRGPTPRGRSKSPFSGGHGYTQGGYAQGGYAQGGYAQGGHNFRPRTPQRHFGQDGHDGEPEIRYVRHRDKTPVRGHGDSTPSGRSTPSGLPSRFAVVFDPSNHKDPYADSPSRKKECFEACCIGETDPTRCPFFHKRDPNAEKIAALEAQVRVLTELPERMKKEILALQEKYNSVTKEHEKNVTHLREVIAQLEATNAQLSATNDKVKQASSLSQGAASAEVVIRHNPSWMYLMVIFAAVIATAVAFSRK